MNNLSFNEQVFFALLRAGLWEKDVRFLAFNGIDYRLLYQIAEEQTVVGLVTAGLEHEKQIKVPQEVILSFVGGAIKLEKKNNAMNLFVKDLFEKMHNADIKAILVKGQGTAQCYERPLWRVCGDVDLLLDDENYFKAKTFFTPLASSIDEEDKQRRHLGMTIGSWTVELHGTLRGGWSNIVDKGIDLVQDDTFKKNNVRIWDNDGVKVILPSPSNDVIFVFTHILQHFFLEGIGLRQICDWCRLLWIYKNEIDNKLIEDRLQSMNLMPKWRSFAALAVTYLGMPTDAMPLYSDERKWQRNAKIIVSMIMESGNFGHNRDLSYQKKYQFVISKAITLIHLTKDSARRFLMFPSDSVRVWILKVSDGFRRLIRKGK